MSITVTKPDRDRIGPTAGDQYEETGAHKGDGQKQ